MAGDDYANDLERCVACCCFTCNNRFRELVDLQEKADVLTSRLQNASRKVFRCCCIHFYVLQVEASRYGTAAMHDKLAAIRLALVSRRTVKR